MRHTARYYSLPYNPELKTRARELRKAGMLHEALMWNQLKRGQLNGLDFDRQKIIGNYIVDFFCAEKFVAVELDGPSHDGREGYDERRDSFLKSLGLTVIHIPVVDVLKNMEAVVEYLRHHPDLRPPLQRREFFAGEGRMLFPSPGGVPEGRGGESRPAPPKRDV